MDESNKTQKSEEQLLEEKRLLEDLKNHVGIRDQMGGSMYWNMLNDECCVKANACTAAGCNPAEVSAILGPGTHTYR